MQFPKRFSMHLPLPQIACFALMSLISGNVATAHDAQGLSSMKAALSELPPKIQAEIARRRAIRKNAAPKYTLNADQTKKVSGMTLEQVMFASSRWGQGQTLTYCFLDGAPKSREQFSDIFLEESRLTNLDVARSSLDCATKSDDIKISFNGKGYWSYIGNESNLIPQRKPSLNLFGMGNGQVWSEDLKGIARHEIGHALGMEHEHQYPGLKCRFKPYKELARYLKWKLADVKANFSEIRGSGLIKTAYDQKSIMHYQLPANYFVDGEASPCFIAAQNTVLSIGDQNFLKKVYPAK